MTPLYARILLPTDGSPLSTRGAKAGVKLAKALGARVTVVYVGMPYASTVYGDAAVYYAGALLAVSSRPWEGILKTARARKSEAIVMASHGRSGLGGLFLGSETQRVLAHSRIPVLVIR